MLSDRTDTPPQITDNPATGRKKRIVLAIFAAFWAIAAVSVVIYLRYKSTHISTDDAYIDGRVHTVASKMSGTVKSVNVEDNQMVRAGDLLIVLDDSEYALRADEAGADLKVQQSKLEEARAKLSAAKMMLDELALKVLSAEAGRKASKSSMGQAERDYNRAKGLLDKDAISIDIYERAKTAYDVSSAQMEVSDLQLRQAKAALETQGASAMQARQAVNTQEAIIGLKETLLKSSNLKVGYTKVYAPADGMVTRKFVQEGNQIQPGQPLMAVVPLDDLWVAANFKETQLDRIKPGNPVDIEIDAYPGMKVRGKVQSIMAGTGTVFSLFPPENASGNFVKVVQRVPVKIIIESAPDPDRILRVGMSVEPTVFTSR